MVKIEIEVSDILIKIYGSKEQLQKDIETIVIVGFKEVLEKFGLKLKEEGDEYR